jgi:predicted enzyme related to lactoylglutathione lyase
VPSRGTRRSSTSSSKRSGASATCAWPTCAIHHFSLAVDDLDTALAELDRRGVQLFAEPFETEAIGRRMAVIKDNSGNLIELSAPR